MVTSMARPDVRSNPSGPGRGRRDCSSGGVARVVRALPFLSVHLGCLAAFAVGVDRAALALCAATYLVRMLGITAGYHRYFSHRAYRTSRPFQFVLALVGCSALQKGPLWWASHHRDHHRHADAPRDPHSPVQNTLWWAHVGWVLAAGPRTAGVRAVPDLNRFRELRWVDDHHWVPGLALAAACYLVGGPAGLVWGFFVSTVLCYHATFAINSLGHRVGSRRYRTDDESRNNLALALVTLGEGWHNNHHHYPGSANQGFFWWEVDFAFYLIKLLERAGLVWDVRRPPPARVLEPPGRGHGRRPPDPQPGPHLVKAAAPSEGAAVPTSRAF
jgi:stearoyl-CoA desaturase (delta-9 desaturase)